jgi:Fe-S cluster biogenesis protein NfuA
MTAAATLVPVHPEAVPDAPDTLRWVVPAGTLDFVGAPSRVPAPLRDLYDAGVLAPPVTVEPTAVLLRIADGASWRADGARVRSALQAALAEPGQWEHPVGTGVDDLLRAAVEDVLAGEVGEFVRGHGGQLEVLDVSDGRVSISLGGACAGCPASGFTIQSRFEAAVRRRCPQLREVVAEETTPWRDRMLRLLPTPD